MVLTWGSPWKLYTGQTATLTASLTDTYFENVTTGEDEDAYIFSADARNIANATNDIATFLMIDNIPPEAYGGSTVIN